MPAGSRCSIGGRSKTQWRGANEHNGVALEPHPAIALAPLLWTPDGGLSDYIKVFVDGREMRHLQGLATPVPPDAQLDVFPPAAGG